MMLPRFRTGDPKRRGIYERVYMNSDSDRDRFLGMMETENDARLVVELMNEDQDRTEYRRAHG